MTQAQIGTIRQGLGKYADEQRFVARRGKEPVSPLTGYGAKANDPTTWGTLDQALQAMTAFGCDGIGVELGGGLCGFDSDHSLDDQGTVDADTQDILDTMNGGYVEVSPSGHGLHIIFTGTIPEGARRKGNLEMYSEGRYFTLTGEGYGVVADLTEQAAHVHKKYLATAPTQASTVATVTTVISVSDEDLCKKISASKNGATFDTLMRGDTSAYKSASEADIAFCNVLAFWTDRDAGRMDRLYRSSGLYREKWDRPQSGSTYGALTIDKAIKECREVYRPEYRQRAVQDFTGSNNEQWEKPVPFETIETPNFPTECLSTDIEGFVEALAESTQTPEEMAAVLSLGVLATAFQSRFEVEITPDWKEPLCLYPVAIAAPGERKSAVISALTAPIYEYEATRREFEAIEIAQSQTEKSLLEKALANAQNQATKKKSNFDASRDEALALSAELAEFKEKHPFRLLVDDTTPEKLVDIMDMQGGCITVASAEGGLFDSLAGRYDRASNFDIYLKGHAGDPIIVDRIGRKPNHIARPRLTMMLTIQPEVLNGLMDNATFRGRGLCGRFLYAVCKSKVGSREVNPAPIPPQTKANYRLFVQRILSAQDTGVIKLSQEAHRVRLDYAACIEQRLGNEWEYMRDWGGKLVGTMLRIAGLIHAAEVMGNPAETLISPETVEAAIKISEFLGAHAMAAYQVMGADESSEDAKYLLRRIKDIEQDEISKRDLFQMCKGKFKKVDDMESAIQTLIEMGYLREAESVTGERGRPSTKLMINPMFKNIKILKNTGVN